MHTTDIENYFSIDKQSWDRLGALSSAEIQTRIDLATCYRLAAKMHWDDGIYTHISAAVPNEPDAYLINQFGLTFDEVTPLNLVKVDTKGNILKGSGPVNISGFAIHGAVHAARKDALCIFHLHNESSIALSAQTRGLLPLSQHAMRFYKDIAYHPYQGLALSSQEQEGLIANLSNKKAMLLRNHGSLVCGTTIQQAFYLMHTLDKACSIQLKILDLDSITYPDDQVCSRTFDQLCMDGDLEGQIEWPAYQRWLLNS